MALTDTSPKAQLVYNRMLAGMTPEQRLRVGVALWEAAGSLQRAAILQRNPEASDADIDFEIAVTRFGPELARAAWRRT
jgi:hypothetical protein